ncbi:MAG TPA: AMP-binding protein [Actinomycetota bacterium]|nr:AMP-binding protein [Actinomycetota bacterium]
MGLAELLRKTAARAGTKKAFIVPGASSVTFADFDAEADRVARGLMQLGVNRGDRVTLAMSNVVHFPLAYFGILRAGAVVVPLNAMLTAAEIAHVIEHSESKVVLTGGAFGEVVKDAVKDVEIVTIEEWDRLGPLGEVAPEVEITDDDLAVLAYTSGTTGEPKAAMLSHRNLQANLDQQMQIPDAHVTEDDVLFLRYRCSTSSGST